MRKFVCTVAAIALATGIAQAQGHGHDKGGGPGKVQGQAGAPDHGPKAGRGGDAPGHGAAMRDARHDAPRKARSDQGQMRGPDRPDRADRLAPGRGKADRVIPGGLANGNDRMDRRDREVTRVVWRDLDRRGLIDGCPPGLAKKNNGCMPPGQFKKEGWDDHDANWWGLRGLRDLNGYRYVDGNLVRLGANGAISGYYPLLGGALALGNPWPSGYPMTPLSPYHVNYYGLGDDYRYLDGAIYRVDPQTQAIQSIAALLTGDDFAVGRPLPSGYGVYNVPSNFRDDYVDGPDATYRYSDGYVYRVNPKTQLIVAAIDLLT